MQLPTPALLTHNPLNSLRMGTVFTQWRTGALHALEHLLMLAGVSPQLFLFPVLDIEGSRSSHCSAAPSHLISATQHPKSSNNEKPQMRMLLLPLMALRCDTELPSPPPFNSSHSINSVTPDVIAFTLKFLLTCPSFQICATFLEKAFVQKRPRPPYSS